MAQFSFLEEGLLLKKSPSESEHGLKVILKTSL